MADCIVSFATADLLSADDFEIIRFSHSTFQNWDNSNVITKVINHNYKQTTKEQQDWFINEYIRKIYPNNDDLNCVLSIFGSALTGKSTKDQDIIFFLGEGSSGKTTLFDITRECLTIYFK